MGLEVLLVTKRSPIELSLSAGQFCRDDCPFASHAASWRGMQLPVAMMRIGPYENLARSQLCAFQARLWSQR
jgi:hypothetical protein